MTPEQIKAGKMYYGRLDRTTIRTVLAIDGLMSCNTVVPGSQHRWTIVPTVRFSQSIVSSIEGTQTCLPSTNTEYTLTLPVFAHWCGGEFKL